jgi:hypothetical protein
MPSLPSAIPEWVTRVAQGTLDECVDASYPLGCSIHWLEETEPDRTWWQIDVWPAPGLDLAGVRTFEPDIMVHVGSVLECLEEVDDEYGSMAAIQVGPAGAYVGIPLKGDRDPLAIFVHFKPPEDTEPVYRILDPLTNCFAPLDEEELSHSVN